MNMAVLMIVFTAAIASVFSVSIVVEKEIVSMKKRTFRLTSEVGVTPRGRTSYVFEVKSCETAIITLSNIWNIQKNKGRYFLLYIGRNHNTQLTLLDSCFGCKPKAFVRKSFLDCNVFKPFWLLWDNMATVSVGEGRRVGQNPLITYTSPRPFPILFSQLTTLGPPTTWKFLIEEEVILTAPHTDGSTTVTVKEDVAVGDAVFQIVVKPEIDFMLISGSHFKISRTKVRTSRKLDYEKDKFHILFLRTMALNISITMTVLVEDVNDETPEVVLGENVRLPEELPVGFIIQGIFQATDRDENDILKYSLEGGDSSYLSVSQSGQVKIGRCIDRDGPNGRHYLDDLVLIVEDLAGHISTHNLNITVTDINDNKPICKPSFISISLNQEKSILGLQCSDLDEEGTSRVSLKMNSQAKGGYDRKTFWLSGTDLFTNVDLLRNDTYLRNEQMFVLRLLAVDTSLNSRSNTADISIVIKLKHDHMGDNIYTTRWVSPLLTTKGKFPDLTISKSASIGTVIQRFFAHSKNFVTYGITSILTNNGKSSMGSFNIDGKTGLLRTAASLDSGLSSGHVSFYNICIMATCGDHNISGGVKVTVKNTSDNSPRFNKTFYIVGINSFKIPKKLFLQFDVHSDTNVSLGLTKDDSHYFSISCHSGKWLLKFRPGVDPQKDITIPPVITITASDNGSPPRTSQTVVILTDLPCPITTSLNVSIGKKSKPINRSSVATYTESLAVPTQQRQYAISLSTRNMAHQTTQEIISECLSRNSSLRSPSNVGLYLRLISCFEGLTIGIVLLLLLAMICCRSFGSSQGRGRCKDQLSLGQPNLKKGVRHFNMKKEDSNNKKDCCSATCSPPVCEIDIIEERTQITHKKINVTCAQLNSMISPSTISNDVMTKVRLKENNTIAEVCSEPKEHLSRLVYSTVIPKDKNRVDSKSRQRGIRYSATREDMNFQNVSCQKVIRKCPRELYIEGESVPILSSKVRMISVEKSVDKKHHFRKSTDTDREWSSVDSNNTKDREVFVTNSTFVNDMVQNELQDESTTSSDHVRSLQLASGFSTNIMCITKQQFLELIKITDQKALSLHRHTINANEEDLVEDVSSFQVNYTVDLLPVTSRVYITRQLFVTLLHGNSSCFGSDIMEVDMSQLKKLLMSRNLSKFEASLNAFPHGRSPKIRVIYLPRNIFMNMISCGRIHGFYIANITEFVEVRGHILMEVLRYKTRPWFLPLAASLSRRTLLLPKVVFLKLLLLLNLDVVLLSKDRTEELENMKTIDSFWMQSHLIAVTIITESVYMYRKHFIQLVIKAQREYNGRGTYLWNDDLVSASLNQLEKNITDTETPETDLKREDLIRKCIAFSPISGMVYLFWNMYTSLTKISLSPVDVEGNRNDFVSLSESMMGQFLSESGEAPSISKSVLLSKYALAFNETRKTYFMQWKVMELFSFINSHSHKGERQLLLDGMNLNSEICDSYVDEKELNTTKLVNLHSSKEIDLESRISHSSREEIVKHQSVFTVIDDFDEELLPIKTTRMRKKRKSSKCEWKKKSKVKPWDKDVRKRLYGTLDKNKSDTIGKRMYSKKKKHNICPESEHGTLQK